MVGTCGAARVRISFLSTICGALILGAAMAASVVELIFRCFFALAPKRYSRMKSLRQGVPRWIPETLLSNEILVAAARVKISFLSAIFWSLILPGSMRHSVVFLKKRFLFVLSEQRYSRMKSLRRGVP